MALGREGLASFVFSNDLESVVIARSSMYHSMVLIKFRRAPVSIKQTTEEYVCVI